MTIEPETLNLASQGVFTGFITLPEGYDVVNIDLSTIVCEGAPDVSTGETVSFISNWQSLLKWWIS